MPIGVPPESEVPPVDPGNTGTLPEIPVDNPPVPPIDVPPIDEGAEN